MLFSVYFSSFVICHIIIRNYIKQLNIMLLRLDSFALFQSHFCFSHTNSSYLLLYFIIIISRLLTRHVIPFKLYIHIYLYKRETDRYRHLVGKWKAAEDGNRTCTHVFEHTYHSIGTFILSTKI